MLSSLNTMRISVTSHLLECEIQVPERLVEPIIG